jgi:phage gpG-like protein
MPIDALTELNGRLMAMLRDADNLRPLYDEIGIFLVGVVRQNFIDQGRPEKWKPSIRAEVTGGQTLRDTGALMNSIDHESTEKGVAVGPSGPAAKYGAMMGEGTAGLPGGVLRPKDPNGFLMFTMTTGMRTRSAKTGVLLKRPIEEGSFIKVKEVKIPARPFLYIPPEDQEKVTRMAVEFLLRRRAA